MPTIEVLAVSPVLPVEDLLAHPEGGPEAAAEALTTLLPGTTYAHTGTGTWSEPDARAEGVVLVSTFGPTTMFLSSPVRGLSVPAGLTTYSVSHQTVSLAWGIDVAGPELERLVALSPGALDYAEGDPLPFEAPFALEESGPDTLDADEYAAAAARWMFGCHPLRPGGKDQVDVGDQPLHTFVPVSAHSDGAPDGPDAGRPRVLQRLFGRR